MKKTLLVTMVLIGLLYSCQESKEETNEPEVAKVEEVDNSEKTEIIFGEFKTLYAELLDFKGIF